MARSVRLLVRRRYDPGVYEQAKSQGRLQELPVNHSPQFAPVLHPTLQTGVEAMVVAAMAWNKAE